MSDYNYQIYEIIQKNEEVIDIDKLDLSEFSLAEQKNILKEIYSYNLNLIRRLKNEVKELNEINCNQDSSIENINLVINNSEFTCVEKENSSRFYGYDLNYYINIVEHFNESIEFETLKDIINENKFDEVINRLLAHFTLENVTINKLCKECNDEEFTQEKKRIQFIIDNLNVLKISEEKDNNLIDNKLIYKLTNFGNVCFLNELSKIKPEYYNSIAIAFNSIIDGSFKFMKRIGKADDGFYSPLFQVRDKYIRIYYIKISANLYLISDVIVKKVQTSKNYSSFVRKISKDTYLQREKFLKLSATEKEKVIEDNQVVTEHILDQINVKKKVL